MEEEKANLIPFARKKKSSLSKSGKGVVVRKPVEKGPDVEDNKSTKVAESGKSATAKVKLLEENSFIDESKLAEIAESYKLNLDQIEKDIVEAKKNKTFIQQLLGVDPVGEEIEHLEKVLKKMNLRIDVRNAISTLIRQQHDLERNLLEAQTLLLQKKVMSEYDAQKLTSEIAIEKLRIEKAKLELERLEKKKDIEDLRKNLQSGEGLKDQENRYSLKDLNALEMELDGERVNE